MIQFCGSNEKFNFIVLAENMILQLVRKSALCFDGKNWFYGTIWFYGFGEIQFMISVENIIIQFCTFDKKTRGSGFDG